jgi:hypothetical protein
VVGAAQAVVRLAAAALALVAASALAQDFVVEGFCRDGQPHGAYELKGKAGEVRVVGAFNRGKRTGSFLFWSSAGARIAQLPYDDDLLNGNLAAWYLPGDRVADPRQKLEASYAQGRLAGVKRSWYPSGRDRTEFRYQDGALVEARAFAENGRRLSATEAQAMAHRDAEADRRFVESLEAIVRANLPRCAPSGDRLEKG